MPKFGKLLLSSLIIWLETNPPGVEAYKAFWLTNSVGLRVGNWIWSKFVPNNWFRDANDVGVGEVAGVGWVTGTCGIAGTAGPWKSNDWKLVGIEDELLVVKGSWLLIFWVTGYPAFVIEFVIFV